MDGEFRVSLNLQKQIKGASRFRVHFIDEIEVRHLRSEQYAETLRDFIRDSNAPFDVMVCGYWYRNSMRHLLPDASLYICTVIADQSVDSLLTQLFLTFQNVALPTMEGVARNPDLPVGVRLRSRETLDRSQFTEEAHSWALDHSGDAWNPEYNFYEAVLHSNPLVREQALRSLQSGQMGGLHSGEDFPPGYVGHARRAVSRLATYREPERLLQTIRTLAFTDRNLTGQAEAVLAQLGQGLADNQETATRIWQVRRGGLRNLQDEQIETVAVAWGPTKRHAADRIGVAQDDVHPATDRYRALFLQLAVGPDVLWVDETGPVPVWYSVKSV